MLKSSGSLKCTQYIYLCRCQRSENKTHLQRCTKNIDTDEFIRQQRVLSGPRIGLVKLWHNPFQTVFPPANQPPIVNTFPPTRLSFTSSSSQQSRPAENDQLTESVSGNSSDQVKPISLWLVVTALTRNYNISSLQYYSKL